MSFYRQYMLRFFALCFVALLLVATSVKLRALYYGPTLSVEWDGFGGRLNYRDVGGSINDCLAQLGQPKLMQVGLLGRSNHKFSGFSCNRVGGPEVLYSLNYEPARKEEFFCFNDAGVVVGRHFNQSVVLNDLEFLKTWDDPVMRRDACGFFRDAFDSFSKESKVHVHCEAGRDRTGAFSAVVAALVAEEAGRLDKTMLDAIECEYRKTNSLKEYKYGRMRKFVEGLVQSGGVANFFEQVCGIDRNISMHAASALQIHAKGSLN